MRCREKSGSCRIDETARGLESRAMMTSNENHCILCQSPASTVTPGGASGFGYTVKCGVCGDYSISNRASAMISQDDAIRYKLSSVLRERAIKGLPPVLVALEGTGRTDVVSVDDLVRSYPSDANEMIERSLMNIARLVTHPCGSVQLEGNEPLPILFAETSDHMMRMSKLLQDLGYVDRSLTCDSVTFNLTASGWDKVAELKKVSVESKQAFAAMWFSPKMDEYFKMGIKPGIETAGDFRALRIDLSEHNNKICDQIIAEIRTSRFVVADFTGNRGGVYFEAGFALGLGLPVIWTVQKEFLDSEGVHFDTRQYNHIVYNTAEELRERLRNRIRATIVPQS